MIHFSMSALAQRRAVPLLMLLGFVLTCGAGLVLFCLIRVLVLVRLCLHIVFIFVMLYANPFLGLPSNLSHEHNNVRKFAKF
jgi:hypothetical protein